MRCITCRVDMMMKDDHYVCPACGGEFFPAEYFKRRDDEEYQLLWEWSQRRYYKALRNEKETTWVGRKVARMAGL